MGCRFCASTLRGLERNLTASEILGQVIAARNDTGERISNIVMMGIGEPLDNYDNVIKFLHLVNSPDGLTNCVPKADIAAAVSAETQKELDDCAGQLISLANEGGGIDNITVILGKIV